MYGPNDGDTAAPKRRAQATKRAASKAWAARRRYAGPGKLGGGTSNRFNLQNARGRHTRPSTTESQNGPNPPRRA